MHVWTGFKSPVTNIRCKSGQEHVNVIEIIILICTLKTQYQCARKQRVSLPEKCNITQAHYSTPSPSGLHPQL